MIPVMEPIIHFHHADILNGETVVIYSLDMDIMPGDFVYIVGKVGSGKPPSSVRLSRKTA